MSDEYQALPYCREVFTPFQEHWQDMSQEERDTFTIEQERRRIEQDIQLKIEQMEREAAYLQKEVDEGMAFPQYVWEVMFNDYDWVETLSIHKNRASAQAVIDAEIAHHEVCKNEEKWTDECHDFHCCDIVYKMRVVRHEVIE